MTQATTAYIVSTPSGTTTYDTYAAAATAFNAYLHTYGPRVAARASLIVEVMVGRRMIRRDILAGPVSERY